MKYSSKQLKKCQTKQMQSFGLLVMVILPYLLKTDWVNYLSLGILVFTTFMGTAFGRAIDARDNLRDF